MAVFFLLVGLEIKREALAGELASPRHAALPIAGAIGGMVVPASIYFLTNGGGIESRGWAIPMATDSGPESCRDHVGRSDGRLVGLDDRPRSPGALKETCQHART